VLETYRSIPGVPTFAFSRVIDSDNSARPEPEGSEKMRRDRKKKGFLLYQDCPVFICLSGKIRRKVVPTPTVLSTLM